MRKNGSHSIFADIPEVEKLIKAGKKGQSPGQDDF